MNSIQIFMSPLKLVSASTRIVSIGHRFQWSTSEARQVICKLTQNFEHPPGFRSPLEIAYLFPPLSFDGASIVIPQLTSPILPHQTVHAVLPHTAFRCSSHRGMRLFPASCCRNLVQPIFRIKLLTRETTKAGSAIFDLVPLHQMLTQALFCVRLHPIQCFAGISIVQKRGHKNGGRSCIHTLPFSQTPVTLQLPYTPPTIARINYNPLASEYNGS